MKNYLLVDPWSVVEDGFHPQYNRVTESLFSLGNGRFGQRGCLEETYSGDTLPGNYLAGVYYPDKTKVGWWKNGYPEYFAKVLNAVDWSSLRISLDGVELDLHRLEVRDFRRVLDMRAGTLTRSCVVEFPSGACLRISSHRFCSMHDPDLGCLRYAVECLQGGGELRIESFVSLDVYNQDANWEEQFWEDGVSVVRDGVAMVKAYTKKTRFVGAAAQALEISASGKAIDLSAEEIVGDKRAACARTFTIEPGAQVIATKYVALSSSMYHREDDILDALHAKATHARQDGWEAQAARHAAAWKAKWADADIAIEGDDRAQQAIRFTIFQLNQTYTGEDARLNIGPKGFTGEKYGGSTYWDTEAYCLPFYLSTAPREVSRNLLMYRHRQLPQAIANAEKLGFKDGAALYPMVTMNGEESHNEWEITFEEIHRNGAIAYAIHDYIRYTGDADYMRTHGLEVLIAIARFWAQRVHWSVPKGKYVMHGVTGPNEYENNVNNNWYTLYIARWCLQYSLQQIQWLKASSHSDWEALRTRLSFREEVEMDTWTRIAKDLYLPEDLEQGIFLQQEGYLDKELLTVSDLPETERPICEHWSWDRILRSCFIKQADVLQGLYFFEEDFDRDTIRRNFHFYEPRTVHESSLSPCVHCILACVIGDRDKAYEMYIRTARLDLDDVNNDTRDGCHITSMAGAWMSLVKGFCGFRVRNGKPCFEPFLPQGWKGLQFRFSFRERIILVSAFADRTEFRLLSGDPVEMACFDRHFVLEGEYSINNPEGQ